MMEFYFGKGTISFAALIALEEIRAPYELVKVDLAGGEQLGEAYRAKNPKARVPLLMVDEGPISETPAILTYLAMRFPEAKLLPNDLYQMARVQESLSYFASTFHVAHSMQLRGNRWSDQKEVQLQLKEKVAQNVRDCAAYVSDHLFKGPYLWGNYTIADAHLYALTNWFDRDGVEINDFSKLAKWRELMDTRAAVKAAWKKSESA